MRAIAVVLCLMLVGCKATQPTIVEAKSEKIRTVVDTLVKIIPDSSLVQALLDCDSLGRVRMRQISKLQLQGINIDMQLDGNNLTVTAKGKDTEKRRVEVVAERKEIPVPYPVVTKVNYLTSWQWFMVWVGRIACIMVLLYLGVKLLGGKQTILLNTLARAFKK